VSVVQAVELENVSEADWDEVVAGEVEPWGSRIGEAFDWLRKTRHVGVRENGRLLAMAGLLRAPVSVADAHFDVAGIGGVIVTRPRRGEGLGRAVIEAAIGLAPELATSRAMLFSLPANVPLYEKFSFKAISAAVFVRQPSGMVEMPMCAMWRPLVAGVDWPEGRVELPDGPF